MLTGEQVRSARALLGWSPERLADAAGIDLDAVRRFEDGAMVARQVTSDLLRRVLEGAGAAFMAGNGSVCVNHPAAAADEGRRPEDLSAENDD
jgi:hypothetical protein